eukprot:COSAG04_NODE_6396_length_1338_cov_0.865214_2_plen_120_part_00
MYQTSIIGHGAGAGAGGWGGGRKVAGMSRSHAHTRTHRTLCRADPCPLCPDTKSRAWLLQEAVSEVAEICGAQGTLPPAVELYVLRVLELFPHTPHPVTDFYNFERFCEQIVDIVGYFE